jgi:hypothetical protein
LLAAAGVIALCLAACENAVEPEIRYIVNEVVVIESGIKIETAEQLAGIGRTDEYPADGEYYLANDIDLSVLWEEDPEDPPLTPYIWRPIGSTCRECEGPLRSTPPAASITNITIQNLPLWCENEHCSLGLAKTPQNPFSGILHGNSHTVSGLLLPTGTDENGYRRALYIGLFGYVHSAYIHDLTLKVANTADNRAAYTRESEEVVPCIGTLAGLAYSSRIENVNIAAENAEAGIYVTSGETGLTSYPVYIGGVIVQGINASLKNLASSAQMDVITVFSEMVGGIAGGVTGSITGAKVTGDITVTSTSNNISVGGICSFAGQIQDCAVDIENLSLTLAATIASNPKAALAGIGSGTITDCAVDIGIIKVTDNDTHQSTRILYVGGISACDTSTGSYGTINTPMEHNSVRFGKIEVTGGESASVQTVYIGGVAGFLAISGTPIPILSGHSLDSVEIAVDF